MPRLTLFINKKEYDEICDWCHEHKITVLDDMVDSWNHIISADFDVWNATVTDRQNYVWENHFFNKGAKADIWFLIGNPEHFMLMKLKYGNHEPISSIR